MNRKHLILCLLALSAVLLLTVAQAKTTKWHQLSSAYTFDQYCKEFNKNYKPNSEEHKLREQIFSTKLSQILAHNSRSDASWKAGVNPLTDLTEEEFKTRLGYKHLLDPELQESLKRFQSPFPYTTNEHLNVSALPDHVDWRDKGVVTSVKDQGNCGSCWTFGTAETVEAHWAIRHPGQLTDLSEQQILDCTPNPNQCGGTGGCNGGTAELAMAQIVVSGGLTTEWLYPYQSYFTQAYQCRLNGNTNPRPAFAKISGYVKIPSNQYEPLMVAVAQLGPIAVSVDASSWQNYETGVFNGCNQTNPDIDHSVQLVGYGTDKQKGMDYWLVRNSWSPAWGEEGYIRLWRSPKETCGTDLTPSDGTGCKNGPKTVTVCGTCGIWYDSAYPLI